MCFISSRGRANVQTIHMCPTHLTSLQPSHIHNQGHLKWYKKVEVSGAYRQGRYKKVWLKSLYIMPIVKIFATLDGLMDGRRTNVRTIHICHTYLTSFQSLHLNNQGYPKWYEMGEVNGTYTSTKTECDYLNG